MTHLGSKYDALADAAAETLQEAYDADDGSEGARKALTGVGYAILALAEAMRNQDMPYRGEGTDDIAAAIRDLALAQRKVVA